MWHSHRQGLHIDSQLYDYCDILYATVCLSGRKEMAHQSDQGRAFRLAAACTECQRRKQKASHYYDYQSEV